MHLSFIPRHARMFELLVNCSIVNRNESVCLEIEKIIQKVVMAILYQNEKIMDVIMIK